MKDVSSLLSVIEEMGNQCEEGNENLAKRDTKDITGPPAVETVMDAKGLAKSISRLSPKSVF